MDARVARPREDEESCDIDDRAEHHRPQTRFGYGSVVIGMKARNVEALVVQAEDGTEEAAEEDGNKGEGRHELGPVPDRLKLDGEGGEVAKGRKSSLIC